MFPACFLNRPCVSYGDYDQSSAAFTRVTSPLLRDAVHVSTRAMSAPQPEHQPWPMKWVALAIILVIVPYTYLTLHFRKPGKAFEPYHDMKERANTLRLLSAGFQRITLEADRPADAVKGPARAATLPARGGLPAALDTSLIDKPLLPVEILTVNANGNTSAIFSYDIEFSCTQPDNQQQFASAALYVRGEQIYVVPAFEHLSGGLLARTRDNFIRLTVPAGALKPGSYRVTLLGSRLSQAWDLQVH